MRLIRPHGFALLVILCCLTPAHHVRSQGPEDQASELLRAIDETVENGEANAHPDRRISRVETDPVKVLDVMLKNALTTESHEPLLKYYVGKCDVIAERDLTYIHPLEQYTDQLKTSRTFLPLIFRMAQHWDDHNESLVVTFAQLYLENSRDPQQTEKKFLPLMERAYMAPYFRTHWQVTSNANTTFELLLRAIQYDEDPHRMTIESGQMLSSSLPMFITEDCDLTPGNIRKALSFRSVNVRCNAQVLPFILELALNETNNEERIYGLDLAARMPETLEHAYTLLPHYRNLAHGDNAGIAYTFLETLGGALDRNNVVLPLLNEIAWNASEKSTAENAITQIARILGEDPSGPATGYLLAVGEAENDDIGQMARDRLIEAGTKCLVGAIQALDGSNDFAVVVSCDLVARMKDEGRQALPALIQVLQSPDWSVVVAAIHAITALGPSAVMESEASFPALQTRLNPALAHALSNAYTSATLPLPEWLMAGFSATPVTVDLVKRLPEELPTKSSRPIVAILDFVDGMGFTTREGVQVGTLIFAGISENESVDMVEREEMEKLSKEYELSAFTDVKAGISVGKIVGADYVISGTIAPVLDDIWVTCRLIDVRTGKLSGSVSVTPRSLGWKKAVSDGATKAVEMVEKHF